MFLLKGVRPTHGHVLRMALLARCRCAANWARARLYMLKVWAFVTSHQRFEYDRYMITSVSGTFLFDSALFFLPIPVYLLRAYIYLTLCFSGGRNARGKIREEAP